MIKPPVFRLMLMLAVGAMAVGCVPIRQCVPSRIAHPGAQETQFENPNDFKNLGPDAWKNEMEGVASWYGADFAGKLTSNGEVYDMNAMTAAHKTLPLGTVVKVNNLDNGKSVQVRINDRGPYVVGRIIDLSKSGAEAIGISGTGTAHVKLEIIQWPAASK